MTQNTNNTTVYHFHDYVLDPARRTLTKAGQGVEIQNQVFDVLAYLVQRSGQVVSKDELLNAVWETQFLTDAAVAKAVMKARSAVGDDGKAQAVIKTLHGKGFMFVAPVTAKSASPAPEISHEIKDHQTGLIRYWRWALALSAIVLFALWLPLSQNEPHAAALDDTTLLLMPFANQTGNSQYTWFEIGLNQASAELLHNATGLHVISAHQLDHIDDMDVPRLMAFTGAEFAAQASVTIKSERFELHYTLHRNNAKTTTQGIVSSPDPALLARRLAEQLAADLAGKPLTLITDTPLLNDITALELYAQANQALYHNDTEAALALLEAALTRTPGDIALRTKIIEARQNWSDLDATIKAYWALLEDVPANNTEARLRILDRLGNVLWYAGDVITARMVMDDALQLSAQVDNDFLLANIFNDLSITLQSQGQTKPAWDYASRALLRFEQLGDHYHASLVRTNLGYLAEDRGQILKARELHQQALATRESFGFKELIAASQYALARTYRRNGQFQEAAALLEQALQTVRELNLTLDEFDNLEELAEVRMRQGRFANAEAILDQAQTLAENSDDQLGVAWGLEVRAHLNRRRQQTAAAIPLLRRSQTMQAESGETRGAHNVQLSLAHAHIELGRFDRASEILAASKAFSEQTAGEVLLLHRLLQAQLTLMTTQSTTALNDYQQALDTAAQAGAADIEVEFAIDLGHWLIDHQQLDKAEAMLAIAHRWNANYYRALQLGTALSQAHNDNQRAAQQLQQLHNHYPEVMALTNSVPPR